MLAGGFLGGGTAGALNLWRALPVGRWADTRPGQRNSLIYQFSNLSYLRIRELEMVWAV